MDCELLFLVASHPVEGVHGELVVESLWPDDQKPSDPALRLGDAGGVPWGRTQHTHRLHHRKWRSTMAGHPAAPTRSHAYSLFILVLTVYSLIIMVALLLPLSDQTLQLLTDYDNAICIVFLVDFLINLAQAPAKSEYFIQGRGWLDLIGSIPTFGILRYTALLRLARLSRLARVARLLQTDRRGELVADIVSNRSRYAAFVTLMLAFIVLTTASIFVLQFESRAPDASIKTGGDALWWAIVTITTVGYGDTFPVTPAGRTTAVFVMFAGVGIIGALASILASVLVPSPDDASEDARPAAIEQELAMMRGELAAMRQALEQLDRRV